MSDKTTEVIHRFLTRRVANPTPQQIAVIGNVTSEYLATYGPIEDEQPRISGETLVARLNPIIHKITLAAFRSALRKQES